MGCWVCVCRLYRKRCRSSDGSKYQKRDDKPKKKKKKKKKKKDYFSEDEEEEQTMVVALSRKERVYTRDSDNGRIDGAGDDDGDEEQALKRVAFDSEDSD